MLLQDSELNTYISKIIIIDIETVSMTASLADMDQRLQNMWSKKAMNINKYIAAPKDESQLFAEKAGIFAEFGKVVCISLGRFALDGTTLKLKTKTIYNQDEVALLSEFKAIIDAFDKKNQSSIFVGHNIKEFDLPFLCRRMLTKQIEIPQSLQLSGKKPWEILHKDTLELWRFGDYKHYVSLELLAACLGVPSSKDLMDGSEVSNSYWHKDQLEAIAAYCTKDVQVTAEVFLKLNNIDQNLTFE